MNYQHIHFKEIDSTNTYLKNSHSLLNDFTFVSADYQSEGKGRNNRTWISEPGDNLMFSFLIKDKKFLELAPIISLLVASEIAKYLESSGIKEVSIKWPNDVFVGEKKICGILAEGQASDYLVIGVGLNVNQASFPRDLRWPATSMLLELSHSLSIDDIKKTLFDQITNSLSNLDVGASLEYFRKRNYLQNRRVGISINDEFYTGRVIGIDDNFCLKVKTKDMVLIVDSGEIEIMNNKAKLTTVDYALGIPSVLFLLAAAIFLETFFYIHSLVCFIVSVSLIVPLFIYTCIRIKRSMVHSVFLDNHRIDAVIFDMDGTLIDSTGLWHEIDKKFFNKRNMELPKDYAQNIVHLGLTQAAKFTKEHYGIKESEQEIMDEWHQMSIDMYRNDVQLKEGALDILEFFKKRNIPMAIATANDDTLYMPCIERLGIGKYFKYIADVNNIKEGKQSAKIYEYLAQKMNCKKDNVLVIEDMPTCVKTAYQNGFITVAVFDDASKEFDKEKSMNSHLFVYNFRELIEKLR